MITADQIVIHAIGDYVIQSDWMANVKTKKHLPAIAHVATYAPPFLLLTQSWRALLFIAITHFIIDRWRLARYICWLKNYLAPRSAWTPPWSEVKDSFGYPKDRPPWLAGWLMIITDNVMHIICNGIAIYYL